MRKILFGSYNIHNGKNGILKFALRKMTQANMDLGVFQKMKVVGMIYMWESEGDWFIAADFRIPHHSGVAAFYGEEYNLSLKALRLHGLSVVSFQMASEGLLWNLMGCYIDLDDTSTIESIVAAIIHNP